MTNKVLAKYNDFDFPENPENQLLSCVEKIPMQDRCRGTQFMYEGIIFEIANVLYNGDFRVYGVQQLSTKQKIQPGRNQVILGNG